MSAYVFLCNKSTHDQCMSRLLFGTSHEPTYATSFYSLQVGDYLFLYDYEGGSLEGPFRSTTKCSRNIEPNAWKDVAIGGFPFQVRVACGEEFTKALTADELSPVLPLRPTAIGLTPPSVIADDVCDRLLAAFAAKNNEKWVPRARTLFTPEQQAAYIFKCDRTTGGKCFHENIMGAPPQAFRSFVSHVQQGSPILLWVIDERKLYGIWRAKERGQYWPGQFDQRFPAVVICERVAQFERGLSESDVRSVVPFDGSYPPPVIAYGHYSRLSEMLNAANGSDIDRSVESVPKSFLADDGHLVASRSEALIDNWLFANHVLHAYDYRVQLGLEYMRADFYLPKYRAYVEFWGMIGNAEYDQRRQKKLRLYRERNLRLVEIYPSDIHVLSEVLAARLGALSAAT